MRCATSPRRRSATTCAGQLAWPAFARYPDEGHRRHAAVDQGPDLPVRSGQCAPRARIPRVGNREAAGPQAAGARRRRTARRRSSIRSWWPRASSASRTSWGASACSLRPTAAWDFAATHRWPGQNSNHWVKARRSPAAGSGRGNPRRDRASRLGGIGLRYFAGSILRIAPTSSSVAT